MIRYPFIFLVLVFVRCASAQSQPSISGPSESVQSQQPQASAKQHKADADNKAATDLSVAVNQLSSTIAAHDQQQSGEGYKNNPPPDWWSAGSNISIAVFTGALVVVGFFQWRTYSRQADLMERGLVVTKEAADAAKLAAETGKQALVLAERAEIQITQINLPPTNLFRPDSQIQVGYKNYGRTTAKDVVASVRFKDMEKANAFTTPALVAADTTVYFTVGVGTIMSGVT